jgi:hypothetical protein
MPPSPWHVVQVTSFAVEQLINQGIYMKGPRQPRTNEPTLGHLMVVIPDRPRFRNGKESGPSRILTGMFEFVRFLRVGKLAKVFLAAGPRRKCQ